MLSKILLPTICRRIKSFRGLTTTSRRIAYPKINKVGSKLEIEEYKSALSVILTEVAESFNDLPLCAKHLTDIIEYSLADQDHYSGFMVPILFRMFQSNNTITAEEVKASNILGYCTDMLFVSCQVTDDLIDGSVVKLGKPCLHKKEGVGMNVITYASLINKSVFFVLKNHFQNHPNYLPIFELMRWVWTHLTYGQIMDNESTNAKFSLELYKRKRYVEMMKFKTCYTSFYLPIIAALYLSNKYNEKLRDQVEKFSDEMGMYFAVLNDMVDCYPDSSTTGSVGTDIIKGKCSWLIVKALEIATDEQRKILESHYRRETQGSEWEVRKVYHEMGMINLFLKYEEDCFINAKKLTEDCDEILKEPLKKVVEIIQTSISSES